MNFPEYATIMEEYKVGVLLDDLETSTIVNAIEVLIENPIQYYELQEQCKLAAAEFIWEKEEKKLIAFYEKIPF
jgi:glycosyltransferase involved in cell wall biosynthesis